MLTLARASGTGPLAQATRLGSGAPPRGKAWAHAGGRSTGVLLYRGFGITGRLCRLLGLSAVLLLVWSLPGLAAPIVWVEPSLARVGPDAPAGSQSGIELHAARGEYESFQMIVRGPAGGLTDVNVAAPDVQGVEFTLYREHYVYLARGTADWATNQNKPLGPGWYPDGLIPFADPATGEDLTGAALDAVPFDLAAGKNQPIWVDVFVRRDAAAGERSATFTVTSDQGQAAVSVSLAVWNFELSVTPALESSFLYWTVRYQLQPEQEMLRHRLMPTFVSSSDAQALMSQGLGAVNVGFWSGADGSTCSVSNPPPSASAVAAAANSYPDGLHLYAYTADEISHCSGLLPTMQQYADALHAAGVDQLITMPPKSDWAGAVDIWVELPKQYVAADVQAAIDRGDRVWSYNCLQQDDYSPKWLLDYAPINYRIQPGFINQSLGLTGLLYWRADLWSADAWNDVTGYSAAYPAEGMLVYPAQQVGLQGVLPSMRLKWLRDGVDDYDYIQLLKERGHGDWALGISRSVGPDWRDWTRDTNALEAARRQLGEKIASLTAVHAVAVTASAMPDVVPSEGTTELQASTDDSLGHGIASWVWSDGGAGGSFSPSGSSQNPTYHAPSNTSDGEVEITLTVTATCGGPSPTSGEAEVVVRVQPVEHSLSVSASASPSDVPSGGTTSLSAEAADTRGHSIVSWSWSDGSAGGSFYPAPEAQNPTYTAAQNTSEAERTVVLTVTALCGGPTPVGGQASTSIRVAPSGLSMTVQADQPAPPVVESEGTAALSASVSGSVNEDALSWGWEDGHVGGAFLPSSHVRNPLYRAPRNTTNHPVEVTLTVVASCSDPVPLSSNDTATLTVEPAEHTLTVRAYVEPAVVTWKGKAYLTAIADDALGHDIAEWRWSDGGAGGSFSPSARVPDPVYRAAANVTPGDSLVTLTVTASCAGESAVSGTGYAALSVRPKPNLKARRAAVPRSAVRVGDGMLSTTDVRPALDNSVAFSDVPQDYWASKAIEACRAAGLLDGYSDGSYRPALTVSRAQIAVYIARALAGGDDRLPSGPPEGSFRDLPSSHWAFRHIEYATAAGVVRGYPDGCYYPAEDVKRGQLAAFLARAMVEPTGDAGLADYQPPDIPSFADVPPDFWAYEYVEYLAAANVTSGHQDGTYRPHSACTRAEAAVYLARAFGFDS